VRRAAAVAVLLLVTACGGPQRQVDIGIKEVPSDVVLGAHATPSPAPGPTATPGSTTPPPPSVVALPPPTFEVGPEPTPTLVAPSPPSCGTANPLEAPAREAPPTISAPPVKALYVFRDVGSYAVSGADARKGTFPATSLRTVGNIVRSSDTSFTFDVAELLGDVTTTTTYDVVGTAVVPAALPAGIYLKQVKSVRGQSASTFAPSPELELAGFPLVRGAAVTSSGVDPQTATSMRFTSTVTGKARVDACGTPLDSWVLELTGGKLINPTQNLDFSATYNVGTEYGGLLLRERTAFAGTDGSDGVSRTNTATITTTPKTS
jgi:hypothetical protein